MKNFKKIVKILAVIAAIVAAAILKACGPDYASTNGMYTALDNGVDMGTYIEFLNKTNGVKADKDKKRQDNKKFKAR